MGDDTVCIVSCKVPRETRAKIERFRAQMGARLPGSNPSLSDTIRVLIERGLKKVKEVDDG